MSLEPSEFLGPYEVQALLGAGGMGQVYRARDTRLGRDAALKVIAPRLLSDGSLRRRFELEARAASILNHPAIVTIYDVGETGNVAWIAMEWVEGETLRDALARGPLPLGRALAIAREIADGLASAHAKGIVHRDLKPENIMLRTDGRAKILDFGLARLTVVEKVDHDAETAVQEDATVEGALLGTIGYMSPEQAAGHRADFFSDQFSFGLLLYEMLAGRRAFSRPSKVETLAAIIREEPAPLSSIRDGIPEELHRVIERCMAKLPEARFASTRDLAAALDAIATEPSLRTTAAAKSLAALSAQATAVDASRSFRVSRRAVFGTLIALILAIAAGVWMRVHRRNAIESLAVLPFENAARDTSTQYLADGLTGSLIDQMARVPSLKVIARTTVARFEKNRDPVAAGRQLGVGAVLVGTISRAPSKLFVTAELVQIPSGVRLWGETYERPDSDLLRVQDSIALEIADGLRLGLTRQERESLVARGTKSSAAYETYLKGQVLLHHDNEQDDLAARALFLDAAEKDPSFADAWLGVATTYARSAGNGYAKPAEAWAAAAENARKAMDLDPGNFGARVSLAVRHFQFDWDWPLAEREFSALSADPRLFTRISYQPAAMFYWATGRPEQSVAMLERALRNDPGNIESRVMLAGLLHAAGRADQSISAYQQIIRDAPEDGRPLYGLAEALARRGDVRGAIEALRKAYELSDEPAGVDALSAARTKKDYDDAQVAVAKERLEMLESLARERYVSPADLARLQAMTGQHEKALATLTRALEERSPGLVFLKVDHAWDGLRGDPAFADLVRKVGIP